MAELMKYRCLVLDHDDTVVNSTAEIHYPAFRLFMQKARPQIHFSLEEYFSLNFDPGVVPLFRDICGLTEEEARMEEQFWRTYVKDHIPAVYDGIREILISFRSAGGIICVSSHSFSDFIRRDYEAGGLPQPDRIYGWDMEPELRKPSPYALHEIMRIYSLRPDEILVLDDLKPGFEMARAAGVPFAAAGWSCSVEKIETFMRGNCDLYFKTVREFGDFLLSPFPETVSFAHSSHD